MPVDLTIKQVPDETARRLRAQASSNHRSLQGELRAILEEAVSSPADARLTIAELWEMGRKAGFATPSESTRIIREARDGRNRR